METFLFSIFTSVAIVSAVFMIGQSRVIYSVGLMMLVLLSVSGLFLLLNAAFLALANAIVYAGAVMMLFVFTAMLLGSGADQAELADPWYRVIVFIGGFLLLVQVFMIVGLVPGPESVAGDFAVQAQEYGSVTYLGRILFTRFPVILQALGLLLLVALVGGVYLAQDPGLEPDEASTGMDEDEEALR